MSVEIIAEFGQSHGGRFATAMLQAAAAKDAGATYVKWQTFRPERLVSPTAGRYWSEHLGGHATQLKTFKANGVLADSDWKTLADYCRTLGVGFMSSPFDLEAVGLLVDAGVDALKVASGEITHLQLLRLVGQTSLPVVLSTGASHWDEIERALGWIGHDDVTLLACSLTYPCPVEDANLARIEALAEFGLPVGYSDHTTGIETALAAVAAGATLLEKHCTLTRGGTDQSSGVPDDRMALNPLDLAAYVGLAQLGEKLRGSGLTGPMESEMAARHGARRSLHAARDIEAGERFGPGDFICLRPAGPFEPVDEDAMIGRVAKRRIVSGSQVQGEDVDA